MRPDGVDQLWQTFADLSLARPQGALGMGAIPHAEIVAYQLAHGVRLTSWEIATLRALDAAWLKDQAERALAKANSGKAPDAGR